MQGCAALWSCLLPTPWSLPHQLWELALPDGWEVAQTEFTQPIFWKTLNATLKAPYTTEQGRHGHPLLPKPPLREGTLFFRVFVLSVKGKKIEAVGVQRRDGPDYFIHRVVSICAVQLWLPLGEGICPAAGEARGCFQAACGSRGHSAFKPCVPKVCCTQTVCLGKTNEKHNLKVI